MGLLEQLRSMQGRLGNERIVVVFTEHPCALQGADDERDRLQLRAALRYAFLVHAECVNVHVVREVLEPALVRNLSGEQEESESNRRSVHGGRKDGVELSNEFEDCRDFRLPIVHLRLC